MSANAWSRELRAARQAEGDSQADAARKLGIKQRGYLSNLELGKKKPSLDLALRAEEVYHVPFRLLRSLAASQPAEELEAVAS